MGRRSKRTASIEKAVLAGLRLGIPLAEICRRPGMPCAETWRNWCRVDYDLEEAYAAARAVGYETIISNLCDALMAGGAPTDPYIQSRLKLVAKWDPLNRI